MRRLAIPLAAAAIAVAVLATPEHYWLIGRHWVTAPFAAPPPEETRPFALATDWSRRLIDAAENQVGTTVHYDPAYVRIDFPGGDVPRERGVCTDVVIRALRDAHGVDLQVLVNRDMQQAFSSYPRNWGLKRPDRNIDHRRVPNLAKYFQRKGYAVPVTDDATNYRPGDLVTWKLPGNLDHIGIVTDRPSGDGDRPLIVHNIGAGTRIDDILFAYRITGHYRLESTD